MYKASIQYMNKKKESHSKVKDLSYKSVGPQEYIISKNISDDQIQTLLPLISNMLRVKANLSGMYPDKLCSFGCIT